MSDAPSNFESLGGGRFRYNDGVRVRQIVVDRAGGTRFVTIEGVGTRRFENADAGRRRGREATPGTLAAPMPGRVVKVIAAAGDSVVKGQELVVLEAMKMEIKIAAPVDGRVKAVHVKAGDSCDAGQTLVEIDAS